MQGWECPKCGRVWAPHVQECESHRFVTAPTTRPVCCTCGSSLAVACPIHGGVFVGRGATVTGIGASSGGATSGCATFDPKVPFTYTQ